MWIAACSWLEKLFRQEAPREMVLKPAITAETCQVCLQVDNTEMSVQFPNLTQSEGIQVTNSGINSQACLCVWEFTHTGYETIKGKRHDGRKSVYGGH